MAKVTGPLMSISASGQVGKSLVFGTWKGIQWVREYVIPANPKTTDQTNVRTAFTLSVGAYKALDASSKTAWNEAASQVEAQSGISLFMKRALKAYAAQITTSVTPVSVTVTGTYPDDTFTWSDV